MCTASSLRDPIVTQPVGAGKHEQEARNKSYPFNALKRCESMGQDLPEAADNNSLYTCEVSQKGGDEFWLMPYEGKNYIRGSRNVD